MRVILPFILFSLAGCLFSSQKSKPETESATSKELTPGIVKKEIRVGMSGAEVIQALGSPNIVTRDSNGKEVWVYDKIGAEVEMRRDASYGTILILGFYSETQTVKTTQKTLTVIITFNNDKVESFSYHYSKF